MKYIGLLVISLFITFSVTATEMESKTFLVIFKAKELKLHKTNLRDIEKQFSSVFSTRSYAGNSELAILINISTGIFDECELGQFLVSLNNDQQIRLENIAFRMVDLTESKKSRNAFLSAYEINQHTKKKANKILSSL